MDRAKQLEILQYNRRAWDKQVELANPWTVPVLPEIIANARDGDWHILLTPTKPVPISWFPTIEGAAVLCLASGGGQQGPILAAAGARVTVFDNSPLQLAQDKRVAEREGLAMSLVEGDMADLSVFPDESFDLIVHPISNQFVPDIIPVWQEAYRVLRPSGVLLSGFCNPAMYIFDMKMEEEQGILEVKHPLPYADIDSLTVEEKQQFIEDGSPFEFSHTLQDQIGGQLKSGFVITGFYEDNYNQDESMMLSKFMPLFMATRSIKPVSPSNDKRCD